MYSTDNLAIICTERSAEWEGGAGVLSVLTEAANGCSTFQQRFPPNHSVDRPFRFFSPTRVLPEGKAWAPGAEFMGRWGGPVRLPSASSAFPANARPPSARPPPIRRCHTEPFCTVYISIDKKGAGAAKENAIFSVSSLKFDVFANISHPK